MNVLVYNVSQRTLLTSKNLIATLKNATKIKILTIKKVNKLLTQIIMHKKNKRENQLLLKVKKRLISEKPNTLCALFISLTCCI
jgi:hypothetical protein